MTISLLYSYAWGPYDNNIGIVTGSVDGYDIVEGYIYGWTKLESGNGATNYSLTSNRIDNTI